LMGTPFYMSPEQIVDSKSIDHRADLWAMAVIAYECLTGYRPFEDDNLVGLAVKINASTAPLPSSRAPVPAGFDELFSTAIARDIELRFQSALAFGERFREICSAAPAEASAVETTRESTLADHAAPPSSNTRTWFGERPARRRGAVSSEAASTAPVSRTNGRAQPTPPRRGRAWWLGGVLLASTLLLSVVAVVVGRGGAPPLASTAASSTAPEPPKPPPATTEPPPQLPSVSQAEPAPNPVTVQAITEPPPAPPEGAAPGRAETGSHGKPPRPRTKPGAPARGPQASPSAAPKPEPPKSKWNSAFD